MNFKQMLHSKGSGYLWWPLSSRIISGHLKSVCGNVLPQVQYLAAIYLYLFKYEIFLASPLVWSVPFTGWMQSVSASLTFTFLPRKKEPGCKSSQHVVFEYPRPTKFSPWLITSSNYDFTLVHTPELPCCAKCVHLCIRVGVCRHGHGRRWRHFVFLRVGEHVL